MSKKSFRNIYKFLLIVPVFVFLIIFGFACDDGGLKSISLSIGKTEAGREVFYSGGYYILNKGDNVKIDVRLSSNNYNVKDLKWKSNNTEAVTIYYNAIKAVGIGNCVISASYTNTDGTIIENKLQIKVVEVSQDVSFDNCPKTSVYNTLDQSAIFKADQDDGTTDDVFNYFYYFDGSNGFELCSQIVNAGNYRILCSRSINDGEEKIKIKETTVDITINPYMLNLTANDYSYTFGNGEGTQTGCWPEKLFTTQNIPSDISMQTQNYFDLKGEVGSLAQTSIGKYIETTSANINSSVGEYNVTIKFDLYDDYKQNFSSQANIINGKLNINKKRVILKIDDQNIIYGQGVGLNKFSLYSFETNTNGLWVGENENIQDSYKLIGDNFSSCIALENNISYYDKDFSSLVNLNKIGLLNVGEYIIKYNKFALKNNNILVEQMINGKINVEKRTVVILPNESQSKSYLDVDPESINYTCSNGIFVNGDEIVPFLSIDYSNPSGSQNVTVDVGLYKYKIDNTLNDNYDVSLDEKAVENNVGEFPQIYFEVLKSNISIRLNSVVEQYKKTKNSTGIHTLSYYGEFSDYKTNLNSLIINSKEMVNAQGNLQEVDINDYVRIFPSETFDNDGSVFLYVDGKEEDYFTFNVSLVLYPTPKNDSFTSYYTELTLNNSIQGNFELSYDTSFLDLTKINVVVTPKNDSGLISKVYDGSSTIPINFGNADYYVLSKSGLDLSKILNVNGAIFNNNSSLLTVENNTGNVFEVGNNYKIILNNITYQPGYDYYNFILDEEPCYFYVTPCPVTIVPDSGQSKNYGAVDKEISYKIRGVPSSIINSLDDINPVDFKNTTNITPQVNLSRISGENVGEYKIILNGSANFGNNYCAILDSTEVKFKIEKRQIEITPIEYTIVYGEDFPDKFGYYQQMIVDNNTEILRDDFVKPTFTGNFAIVDLNGNNVDKIGSYYSIGNYKIAIGSFSCSNNYEIILTDGIDFTIHQRNAILNINSRKVDEVTSLDITDYSKDFFTLSNIIDDASYKLNMKLLNIGSIYKIDKFIESNATLTDDGDYKIIISKNNVDITKNYNIILGKNIVFTQNIQIIELAIENEIDGSNEYTAVYNGSVQNELSLVCKTEGYTITDSDVEFKYSRGAVSNTSPINVGTYIVEISSINLTIRDDNLSKEINFTDLDGEVDNCILNVPNVGFITITKSTLSYNQADLSFGSLVYGSNELPQFANSNIFKGVNNNTVTLKDYIYQESPEIRRNYFYSKFDYDFSTMDVSNNYLIDVTVESNDGNYEPLNIKVPLSISQKEIVYSGFLGGYNTSDLNYDGRSKLCSFKIIDSENNEILSKDANNQTLFTLSYTYYQFKVDYSADAKDAKLYCYTYSNGIIDSQRISKGFKDIQTAGTIEIQGSYVIMGGYAIRLENGTNVIPVNACIYICMAIYSSSNNYIFKATNGTTSTSVKIGHIYEITRAEASVLNWKEEFYYTTRFNFDNPSTLPFVYNVNPSFLQDSVEISYTDTKIINNIDKQYLPVNNNGEKYSINITINSENYYYSGSHEFVVIDLPVEFVLPQITTYSYSGSEITSYFKNIGVILKDLYGEIKDTIYYASSADSPFSFKFYYIDDGREFLINKENDKYSYYRKAKLNEFYFAPKEIDDFKVEISYNNNNYKGETSFYYSILPRAYSGKITFSEKTIVYNPTRTIYEYYNIIINSMFKSEIEASLNYTIQVVDKTDNVSLFIIDENKDVTYNEQIEEISQFAKVGKKYLELTIDFLNDDTLANSVWHAYLNITSCDFDESTCLTYAEGKDSIAKIYDGSPYYQELAFFYRTKKVGVENEYDVNYIRLGPNTDWGSDKIECKDDMTNKTYYVGKDDEYYVVYDEIENIIFKVSYTYFYYKNSQSTILLNSKPVVPNTYRVSYNIMFGAKVGSCYSRAKSTFSSREFSINKMNSLYVNINGNINFNYSGNSSITVEDVKNKITIKNNSLSSSNVQFYVISVQQAMSYDEEKGICLFAYFTKKGESERKESIKETGEYVLHVTLAKIAGFELASYFEDYSLNSKTIMDFKSTAISNIYEDLCSKELQIENSDEDWDLDFSANSFNQILNFTGNIEVVNIESVECLKITKTSTLSVKDGYLIKVLSEDGSSEVCSLSDISNLSISDISNSVITKYKFKIYKQNYNTTKEIIFVIVN